jgi:hypothetical protein
LEKKGFPSDTLTTSTKEFLGESSFTKANQELSGNVQFANMETDSVKSEATVSESLYMPSVQDKISSNLGGPNRIQLEAAATLQAATRGMIARRSFSSVRRQTMASLVIQNSLVKWWEHSRIRGSNEANSCASMGDKKG